MSEPVSLREQIQAALRPAMKAGDKAAVSVIRTTLAAIANAEAVDASEGKPAVSGFTADVARRALTDDDVRAVVVGCRDELVAAATEMTELDQPDRAAVLAAQARLLDSYLS